MVFTCIVHFSTVVSSLANFLDFVIGENPITVALDDFHVNDNIRNNIVVSIRNELYFRLVDRYSHIQSIYPSYLPPIMNIEPSLEVQEITGNVQTDIFQVLNKFHFTVENVYENYIYIFAEYRDF